MAINAASTALALSEIPFYHPIGAVRVALVDDEIVFNPANSQRDMSDLDLVVVGTDEAVVMVEAGANQVPEDVILDCIFKAHEQIRRLVHLQHEMFRASGITKPSWETPAAYPPELYDEVKNAIGANLKMALHTTGKFARRDAVAGVVEPYRDAIPEEDEERHTQVKKVIKTLEEEYLREGILGEQRRFDDRRLDEIRDIDVETGVLPRTHGSAVFQRGETQALVTATLGSRRDAQIIEEYEGESLQKFLLHYNFPPFSVGEARASCAAPAAARSATECWRGAR